MRRLALSFGIALAFFAGPAFAQLTPAPTPVTGVGAGTVTSITCSGVTCTPNPLTGAGTISGAGLGSNTYTGKQILPASTTGAASLNMPSGVTPTSPFTGDLYFDGTGLYYRNGSGWVGPLSNSVSGSGCLPSPSANGSFLIDLGTSHCGDYGGGSVIGVANGGTAISSFVVGNMIFATGTTALAQGQMTAAYVWSVPSSVTVTNGTTVMDPNFQFTGNQGTSGTITSCDYGTSGSSTPSFTATVQINGVNVTGCSSLTVNSSTNSNSSATANNAMAQGSILSVIISGVTGSPNNAWVKINYTHTAF